MENELKSKPFRTHVLIRKTDKEMKEDPSSLERARKADQIYRKACAESGVMHCFFQKFGTWSDYVQGRIDEDELRHKASLEIGKIRDLE